MNTEAGLYGSDDHAASAVGNVPAAGLLLIKGVEVTAVGVIYRTPLQAAAVDSHSNFFIDLGRRRLYHASPWKMSQKPLRCAFGYLVGTLCPDQLGGGFLGGALQAAAYGRNFVIVEKLLGRGAEIEFCHRFFTNTIEAATSRFLPWYDDKAQYLSRR